MSAPRRGGHLRTLRACAYLTIAALVLSLAKSGAAQNVDGGVGARQALITVKGVANPFTAFGILRRLKQVPGVTDVNFDLYSGQAIVTLAPAADVSDAQLREAVYDASYTADKIEWRRAPAAQHPATER